MIKMLNSTGEARNEMKREGAICNDCFNGKHSEFVWKMVLMVGAPMLGQQVDNTCKIFGI